jgi:hypothetical protein
MNAAAAGKCQSRKSAKAVMSKAWRSAQPAGAKAKYQPGELGESAMALMRERACGLRLQCAKGAMARAAW